MAVSRQSKLQDQLESLRTALGELHLCVRACVCVCCVGVARCGGGEVGGSTGEPEHGPGGAQGSLHSRPA